MIVTALPFAVPKGADRGIEDEVAPADVPAGPLSPVRSSPAGLASRLREKVS
jgi:hypothetical protein